MSSQLQVIAIESTLGAIVDVVSKSADPQWFGDRLVKKRLIAEGLMKEILRTKPGHASFTEANKVEELMKSVLAQVNHTPFKYGSFVSILEEEPALASVAKAVRNKYKQLRSGGHWSQEEEGLGEGTSNKQGERITDSQGEAPGTTENHGVGTALPLAKPSAGTPTSTSKSETSGSRKRPPHSEPGSLGEPKAKRQQTGQLCTTYCICKYITSTFMYTSSVFLYAQGKALLKVKKYMQQSPNHWKVVQGSVLLMVSLGPVDLYQRGPLWTIAILTIDFLAVYLYYRLNIIYASSFALPT